MLQNAVADEILAESPSDQDELIVTGSEEKVQVKVRRKEERKEEPSLA